jgi:hypothetical protein
LALQSIVAMTPHEHRPSLIIRWPDRVMKLEWFLWRGATIDRVQIMPSLVAECRQLSGHDLIIARVTGLDQAYKVPHNDWPVVQSLLCPPIVSSTQIHIKRMALSCQHGFSALLRLWL